MRRFNTEVVFGTWLLLCTTFAFTITNCSPSLTKTIVRSVIDVALATCISEHADVSDEAALRGICQWTDELAPTVKDLLAARSKGLGKAKAATGPCKTSSDAGTADSGK